MKYLEKEYNWDTYVKNKYEHDSYYYAKENKHVQIIKHLEYKMFYEKI